MPGKLTWKYRCTIFIFPFVFANLEYEQPSVNFLKPFLPPDEREIIDSIAGSGGDRKKAEERLFNRYAYFIKEAIYKFSLSEEEASDLYSDTIISAIDKIANKSFEGRSSLKTWLYSIFHNKYVDLIRKKTTNKSSIHQTLFMSDMLLEISDRSKTVIQELVEQTDWELLRQRLEHIGDSCKQMLTLWADGYSDKEIAAELKYKTPDVVKTSRLRCLEKLRKLYRTT